MTITHATTTTESRPWQRRLAATSLIATGAAVTVWAIATAAGIDLAVRSGGEVRPIGLGSVLTVALLAAVAGGLTHRLAGRWARGQRVWTVVATIVLVLSLTGPLGATTAAGAAALAAMHLVVGLTVIVRQSRRTSRGVA
jgi:lysylphosphatidylglycerol synthetase-like protein (DUF2156 family)